MTGELPSKKALLSACASWPVIHLAFSGWNLVKRLKRWRARTTILLDDGIAVCGRLAFWMGSNSSAEFIV